MAKSGGSHKGVLLLHLLLPGLLRPYWNLVLQWKGHFKKDHGKKPLDQKDQLQFTKKDHVQKDHLPKKTNCKKATSKKTIYQKGHLPEQFECVENGPVGELGVVAQVAQIVDVTEQLVLQPRVGDHGDGTVLVEGAHVGFQPRRKIRQMVGDFLNHKSSHLMVPNGLWLKKFIYQVLYELTIRLICIVMG